MHSFNKLFLAAVVATVATVSTSVPASAVGICESSFIPGCEGPKPKPQPVPEPSLMLGSLVLGGALVSKKLGKKNQENN
ncbi:hypothetical protein [Mastigocoleus sp. MO_188.B34]|uniref:hypothetical protein n=1 Tax=Mastigocoleus sp. MO_188.B34 TaxID=3036635 RepID=UPI002632F02C|nr:hypothetical protein [Mastigocoleus sp. MO_188.B34]MDJ0697037.1 hypothetical protein [Mastigocoleus sp. MO_188.B34]